MLTKKREMKVKLELAGKLDKVAPVETEIAEVRGHALSLLM